MEKRKGFTLIELVVTLAIIVVVGTVATLNLFGNRNTEALTMATKEAGALLREAESDAAAGEQGAAWGVHFDNTNSMAPFFEIFYSTSSAYASSTAVGHYPLPASVCFDTDSIPASSTLDVIFAKQTGTPSATATITFDSVSGPCSTATSTGSGPVAGGVSRVGSGKIFFDDFQRTNL